MGREKTARLYIRRELHRKVKIAAAKDGKTLRQFIEEILAAYEQT